ncbi:SAVED domain-containing protein [Nonomuraea sp. FMUSA5-5]|uniref:SAVED domain-containing protein n=1 Tax=Nonomuraea composti TaxID=2720023 RepID=A0ABX1BKP5_9ACTN|nr:SAVED domain-containing protein [Nonomuraea sp. FMUSA5-5]
MTHSQRPDPPRLTVVGSAGTSNGSQQRWAVLTDGTASLTIGGAMAGGFGVEATKSFLTNEVEGRWWFVLAFAAGLAFVALGLRLRGWSRRQMRVGIVVTAMDARRGLARAQQLDQQAETFSRNTCTVTLKTNIDLPGDGVWDRRQIDALADETLAAATMAERLTPDAVQINLIPTMPLHVAFWFGARLGYTHAREIVVHAIRQADGAPAYFPATSLRTIDSAREPLTIERLDALDDGDPTKVALALDLQGRGDQFFDQVMATCRQQGIGYLLRLRSTSPKLTEDRETFTGVVEQTCRAWREAPLPAGARTGQHAIFLSGPVAIAVVLGARLASPEHGRWTAFTFDAASNSYEPFPPPIAV